MSAADAKARAGAIHQALGALPPVASAEAAKDDLTALAVVLGRGIATYAALTGTPLWSVVEDVTLRTREVAERWHPRVLAAPDRVRWPAEPAENQTPPQEIA